MSNFLLMKKIIKQTDRQIINYLELLWGAAQHSLPHKEEAGRPSGGVFSDHYPLVGRWGALTPLGRGDTHRGGGGRGGGFLELNQGEPPPEAFTVGGGLGGGGVLGPRRIKEVNGGRACRSSSAFSFSPLL